MTIKSVIQTMTDDRLIARKAGDSAVVASLGYILGKMSQLQNPTDEDTIATIRAYINGVRTDSQTEGHEYELTKEFLEEEKLLTSYLPKFLTDIEIRDFVLSEALSGNKIGPPTIGKIIRFARSQGKIVDSKISKSIVDECSKRAY